MSGEKIKYELVEDLRLFPGHGVSDVLHHGPFVAFHVRGPEPHHGRWRQEIGIGGDDQRLMLSVASVTVFMLTSYLLLLILY